MSDPGVRVRRAGRVLLLSAISLGVVMLVGRALAGLFTEVLWYRSVGYERVFWTRLAVEGGTKVLAGALAAVLAFLNFRVVARSLHGIQIRRKFGNLEIAERIPRRAILLGVTALSAFLGLWLGAAFPDGAGMGLLLLFRAPEWGLVVPPLGRDVSFFVFTLPVLGGALTLGLALLFLLLSFSVAGYAATGSISARGGRLEAGALPWKHLSILGALFLLILAGRFLLAPFHLMLDGNSAVQGIFGFADYHARVPGYRILAAITLMAAGVAMRSGFRRRPAPLLTSGLAVVLGGLGLVQVYPSLVQRFQVEPNELVRETPFIEANIRFTRIGFGLDRLQRRDYDYAPEVVADLGIAASQFAGLPIWTPDALLTTFRQVEARFRYYDFGRVTVDRYPSSDGVTPVAVAVREIDPLGIEDPNWQNLHIRTRFQAGMGAVAAAANQRTPEGRPLMLVSGIPPVSTLDPRAPEGLVFTDPSIYFGPRAQLYAIVSPDSVGSPVGTDRRMPAGIELSSLLRKLALAWRVREANVLFASEVSPESRFVFRRSVVERASAIAPFLRFLGPPYPVLHEGSITWILDGFTATRNFPISTARILPGAGAATYLRNSVKVTVDGVTGETQFYRVEEDDPLLEAWSRVFPSLLRPFEEMPSPLQAHILYPRELLEVQAGVLLQYHQGTAPRLHGQQDVWAIPQELSQGSRPVPYVPEYGAYRLPGEDDPEFLLSTVFVPVGRQNLTALLAARCDPQRYGELLLFDILVEEQVPGPRQVEALVEQDPVISQQLSLWRQGGSQVWSGHLHIVPVGRTLLYMEPIFLAADADAIPELRRFVVSDGRRVVMEPTLEEAMMALALASGTGGSVPGGTEVSALPAPAPGGSWPREALELLEEAEDHLRRGDWAGFGRALEALRALLRDLATRTGEG